MDDNNKIKEEGNISADEYGKVSGFCNARYAQWIVKCELEIGLSLTEHRI